MHLDVLKSAVTSQSQHQSAPMRHTRPVPSLKSLLHVLQLRQLSLLGDYTEASKRRPAFPHQLSTLRALQVLQVMFPFQHV